MHDEAEIRGHRRTYIGALPGNVIQSLKKAGTRNPVFMLDEIDKLNASHQGDPSSALLEVLDPEQNGTFRDNYIAQPFDLSRVLFVATANQLDTIPGPLRDRMEIIQLTGYTQEEKLQIAKRYLVQRQLKANGLSAEQVTVTDEALSRVIGDYTRESGVRNLEREIGGLFRQAAMRIAEGKEKTVRFDAGDVPTVLGPTRYENEVAQRTAVPGVSTGLAWTPVGGDILFIESARTPGGSGKVILTGQLGDVMKESAQTALSLVKSQTTELGIDPILFDHSDIHVHVPAGAIPKDGPSAGVAMFVSLASLLKGRAVRPDVAMTGEISLRGLVLPVGGIKEKTIARGSRGNQEGHPSGPQPARPRGHSAEHPGSTRVRLGGPCLRGAGGSPRGRPGAGGEARDGALGQHQDPGKRNGPGGKVRLRAAIKGGQAPSGVVPEGASHIATITFSIETGVRGGGAPACAASPFDSSHSRLNNRD